MQASNGKTYWVYITASGPHRVLYVGMTSDLAGRAWEHRERVMDGFTKRYWVDRLVYFEPHDDAAIAAKRERATLATGLEDPTDREGQPDVARPVRRCRVRGWVRVVDLVLEIDR